MLARKENKKSHFFKSYLLNLEKVSEVMKLLKEKLIPSFIWWWRTGEANKINAAIEYRLFAGLYHVTITVMKKGWLT